MDTTITGKMSQQGLTMEQRVNELEKEVMIGLHNQETSFSRSIYQIQNTLSILEIKIPLIHKKINLIEDELSDLQDQLKPKSTSDASMESFFIVTLFLSILVSILTNRILL